MNCNLLCNVSLQIAILVRERLQCKLNYTIKNTIAFITLWKPRHMVVFDLGWSVLEINVILFLLRCVDFVYSQR